jgi:uncharacterized damage-inducible protein DinB
MHVADLIRYSHIIRASYLDAFMQLPWSTVVANRGLSWGSMRNVFVHLTLVEDRWISYIIPGRFSKWVDPDFDAFPSVDSLRAYMQQVHQTTETYLRALNEQELNRQIPLPWSEKPTSISVEACLTHMVMEDMVHYGELSAALWQMGKEAPYKAYWRFESNQL